MNLTGQFLISMPRFKMKDLKKQLYICVLIQKTGLMGIIINKKIDYDLYPDLLEQLGIDKPLLNKKLYLRYGGPVESGRGFVLHSDEVIQKETLSIAKGIALTSTSEFFEDLSKGKGPKNSILALGYAGWGAGQIELEIASNSWMTLKTDNNFIFDENVNNKWTSAYNLLGVDPNQLSHTSGSC